MATTSTAKHLDRLMLPRRDLLLAVSGGGDSMVMLDLFARKRKRYRIEVAHVNHGLRGQESDADESLVVRRAAELGLACHVRRARPLEARLGGESAEEYLRHERHALLNLLARERGLGVVAFAHTADDLAETFLMHLARGAGVRGLAFRGEREVEDGLIYIRPLWKTAREAVRAYATERAIEFREDVSNESLEPLRNRARHELLPLLKERFSAGIVETLVRTGERMAEIEEFLSATAKEALGGLEAQTGGCGIPVRAVRKIARGLAAEVLREWVRKNTEVRITSAQVRQMLLLKSGGSVALNGGWTVAVESGHYKIYHPEFRPREFEPEGNSLGAGRF